jgi:hypothetical protein
MDIITDMSDKIALGIWPQIKHHHKEKTMSERKK